MRTRTKSEFMRVDASFFNILERKVVRDSGARKYLKKQNPNIKIYPSFKEATRDLARELQDKW